MISETPNSVNRLNIDYSEEYLKSDEYLTEYLQRLNQENELKIEEGEKKFHQYLNDTIKKYGKIKAGEMLQKDIDELKSERIANIEKLRKRNHISIETYNVLKEDLHQKNF